MTWAVILLSLGVLQDKPEPIKIQRSEAAEYRKALNAFKVAAKQAADDPQSALDTCNRLIDDITSRPDVYARIKDVIECNLRIEAPTGGYGDPVPFTPYLIRGRARLALVKATKGSDVTLALKEMEKVFSDLKIAIDRGSDAQEDLARANDRMKEIKALVGSGDPGKPLETVAPPGKVELEVLKDKFQSDPKSAIDYYDQKLKVFAGTPFDQEALLIRRTAVLQIKVGQRDYDAIIKYCDEMAPFVKGTNYARMFDRERREAADEIVRATEKAARDLMTGIRALASAGEHAKVIAKYDEIAAKLKSTEYAPELEKLVNDARAALVAGAVSMVVKKLDPIEAMFADPNMEAAAILNECAKVAPEVNATPAALSKLNDLRDRAKKRLQQQWVRLCDDRRFASASKLVEQSAKHLAESELKNWNDEIRKRCASHLVLVQKGIQSGLADALRPPSPYETLSSYSLEDLRRTLQLPDPKELVIEADPALAWSGEFRKVLETVAAAGDPVKVPAADFLKTLEALNTSVVVSATLVAGGDANPYFKGSEALSFDLARRRVSALVEQARPAGRDKRKELREQGDAVSKSMAGLAGRIELALQKTPDKGKAFRTRFDIPAHMASIDEVWKRFPIDVERIGKIWEELFGQPSKGAYGATPLSDLEVREKELWALYDSSWGSLAVESRKELARCLMVTTVMHHLLAGRKAQDVAQGDDVRKEKRLLAEVGGLTDQDLKGISPKVRKVIEAAKP